MARPICFHYGAFNVLDMKTIGERIRDRRKELSLRQGDLAELAALDQSTVSDIERGRGFGADVLMRLCVALRTDPYTVMEGANTIQADEMRLLSLFRVCSERDRKNLLESADAFAARNEKPATPSKKALSPVKELMSKLPEHLDSPIQETYVGTSKNSTKRKGT